MDHFHSYKDGNDNMEVVLTDYPDTGMVCLRVFRNGDVISMERFSRLNAKALAIVLGKAFPPEPSPMDAHAVRQTEALERMATTMEAQTKIATGLLESSAWQAETMAKLADMPQGPVLHSLDGRSPEPTTVFVDDSGRCFETWERAAQSLHSHLLDMRRRKDEAYEERNRVVALLASLFLSGIARPAIEGWDPEWLGCVYIDLPTGQASWHYHDSHAHLFAHLPPYKGAYDGHTTEEKYERVAKLCGWEPLQIWTWMPAYTSAMRQAVGVLPDATAE